MGIIGAGGIVVAGSCNTLVTQTVIDRTKSGLDVTNGGTQIQTIAGQGVKQFCCKK